jgi:hypothetical protein
MVAEEDAEEIQGQSLLVFQQLGYGEEQCCSLGVAMEKPLLFAWCFLSDNYIID